MFGLGSSKADAHHAIGRIVERRFCTHHKHAQPFERGLQQLLRKLQIDGLAALENAEYRQQATLRIAIAAELAARCAHFPRVVGELALQKALRVGTVRGDQAQMRKVAENMAGGGDAALVRWVAEIQYGRVVGVEHRAGRGKKVFPIGFHCD